MRITQHLHQEGIDIGDLPGIGIENEDAVLGGLKEPAVACFRNLQGRLRLLALSIGGFQLGDALAQDVRLRTQCSLVCSILVIGQLSSGSVQRRMASPKAESTNRLTCFQPSRCVLANQILADKTLSGSRSNGNRFGLFDDF